MALVMLPLNADAIWNTFRMNGHKAVTLAFGKKPVQDKDWFAVHSEELFPVIKAKCTAYLHHSMKPSPETYAILRVAKSKLRQPSRPFSQSHWLDLWQRYNLKGRLHKGDMYEGIKKAIGP